MRPNPDAIASRRASRRFPHRGGGRRACLELAGAVVALSMLVLPRAFAGEPEVATPKANPATALELASDRPGDAVPARGLSARATAGRRVRPMFAEMTAAVERERTSLADLSRRFRAATTAEEALAVQREIERVKHETELSLLRIQAEYARRAGRPEAAALIEAAIVEMTRPTPSRVAERSVRPAPDGR